MNPWTFRLVCALAPVALACGCRQAEVTPARAPEITPARAPEIPPEQRVTSFPWPEESMAEHPAVKELELPLYPGARADLIDGWIQLRGGERAVTQVSLRTPDSVEAVKAFYLARLPQAKAFPADLEDPGDTGATVVYGPPGEKRVVHIYRSAGTEETSVSAHWLKDCDMAAPDWAE